MIARLILVIRESNLYTRLARGELETEKNPIANRD